MFGQNNDHQDDQQHHDNNTNGFLANAPFVTNQSGPPADDTSTATATAPPETTPSLPQNLPGNDELLDIKQTALQELTPLVGHLEQTPEERFKTTMMMIQATDDHSLIKSAYESAKQISDEKTRAQALLDVVNEINYFTQNHHAN